MSQGAKKSVLPPMISPPDISTVGWVIADVARLNRKLVDRRLSAIGITRAQWQAIGNLWRYGQLTQAALADVMELQTATVARLIDRLEAAGWVNRLPDPKDRRANLIAMTEKAHTIIEEVAAIGKTMLEDMLVDLSATDRNRLVSTLTTVKSRLVNLLGHDGTTIRALQPISRAS